MTAEQHRRPTDWVRRDPAKTAELGADNPVVTGVKAIGDRVLLNHRGGHDVSPAHRRSRGRVDGG